MSSATLNGTDSPLGFSSGRCNTCPFRSCNVRIDGSSGGRVQLKARHSGQWSIVRVVLVGFDMEQRLAVLQPHLFEGVPLPAVAQQAGVPLRTARRWVAAYRAGGADGLTRAARADRDIRRIPAQVVEVVEGLALRRPPPRIAEVHRAVTTIAAVHGTRRRTVRAEKGNR